KLGTAWRFKRSEIEHWIDRNLAEKKSVEASSIISLRDVLSRDHVVKFDTSSKRESLQHLMDAVGGSPHVGNRADLEKGILDREELMSTGIGLGVAVPHVRLKSIKKPMMAVGVCASDITDYDSIDDQPVRLLFMILAGSHQHALHIKVLARIANLVKDSRFRDNILSARDVQSTFDLLVGKVS
ncbi:MAG: PTS sugar transporter subunit IIA, partial [Phycisphaeraceae bacterium]|nr:PTS sugar transporter subunit IIA [Phycisphaeraceae bacterium]